MARYGGEDCVAVDVRLADGRQYRLFWPRDLEEISPKARWRFLFGEDGGS